MTFGIKSDALRAKHPSWAVSDFSNGIAKRACAIQHLNTKIHGIDDYKIGAVQAQFGREIELAIARSRFADDLQNTALHVRDKNLVTQRVGEINALCRRIHRNACGTLEESFPALEAADCPPELSIRIENKDLARLRISHIQIVL